MTETTTPRLRKWVFFLGDAMLLALAWWIMKSSGNPIGFAQALICFLAVAVGAWFAIMPFLREYQAELKLTESTRLNNATAALKNLEKVAGQITNATSEMSSLRELCHETVESTRSIAEGVSQEARRFSENMLKANDQEKHNLRLELEKVRRAEGDWVQVLTRILDHTYALHQAGIRSGQRPLMTQLSAFQNACRDAARRVGLVPIEAAEGENFDPTRHQLPQEDVDPGADPRILGTLATGYSYQGNLLRPILVQLNEANTNASQPPSAEEPIAEEPIAEEPIAEEPIAEEPIAEEPIAEETPEQETRGEELDEDGKPKSPQYREQDLL